MNFLGHLYLAGESGTLKIGNFIGDFVKGREFLRYPEGIGAGILMHRSVDAFTDHHPDFMAVRNSFRPSCKQYAGIVADLVTDHLLASSWNRYSRESLADFSASVYTLLSKNHMYLPAALQRILPVMIRHKRLESYATIEGITESLEIMNQHTALSVDSQLVAKTILKEHELLEHHFHFLMHDAIDYVNSEFGIMIGKPC